MTIEEKIRSYIAKNLLFTDKEFPYADTESFLEEGIVDSIGIMELVFFIEEQFGISVEDHEITPVNFDSVTKLANYIRHKMLISA